MSFAAALAFAPKPEAPVLREGDVALRPHVLSDFDAFWEFYQTDRSGYVGAPKNKTQLWYGLGSEIASWQLRGMGGWAIDVQGKTAGQIVIGQPPHFPEIEIGWILFDGFEGRGIAARAARLALDWYWAETDQVTLVSYIDPDNARSIALATRLGAGQDPAAPLPAGETADDTLVYRHRRPA